MSIVAEVRLWGSTIGAVSLTEGSEVARFEYDRKYAESGVELSPLMMPLSASVYSFPELARETFHGLPGLLSDSLPDKYGNALIDAWLAKEGRLPESFNAIERLSYTGNRGMGALEFKPMIGPQTRASEAINVGQLVELASEILTERTNFRESFSTEEKSEALRHILMVGTSAGGARAKAVIAWNPSTNEVRSGQIEAGPGFEFWLLKFDGVSGNRDKEFEDPDGYGAIEYAYYKMAESAGIQMNESRLLEENGRRHFMTRRFDRKEDGQKVHMQTLGALAHYDFNMPGAYSYEQALLAIRRMGLSMSAVEEQFRRMVFNVIARNQDDHVKNIAFLMDREGRWSLSPAFDMIYSYNPRGAWTSSHQMTINGKRDHFTFQDFKICAEASSMKRGAAGRIVEAVQRAVLAWPDFASEAGVDPLSIERIQKVHRTDILTKA